MWFGLKIVGGTIGISASHPGRRQRGKETHGGRRTSGVSIPEQLEPRILLAQLVGRDTSDFYMREGERSNPQWNMEKVLSDVTWTVYSGQPRNVVAVMDYGLDFTHEDFGSSLSGTRGQLWDRALFGSDPNILASKRGRDEINNVDGSKPGNEGATKPNAGEDWGNHAAGIIGAATDNRLGVAGMNWSIQMLSSKVLQGPDPYDVPGFNLGVLQRAVDHVRYLRNETPTNEQLIRAVAFGYSTRPGIDYGNPFPIWAQLGEGGIPDPKKGVLVTVPAGDFGPADVWAPLPEYYARGRWDPNPNPPDSGNFAAPGTAYNLQGGEDGYSPGSTDNVIVVGATDQNDRRWERNSNVPRIDIYAPGVQIISVGDAKSRYRTLTGTRQAAAHVSGAISLIYDAAAQHGKEVTYHEVRRAIIQGGDDIGLDAPRLNVVGALRYLGLETRPTPGRRTLTLSGGAGPEGDFGQSQAVFKLSLDEALSAPLPIQVQIADGSATRSGRDYVGPAAGVMTVVIPAGKKEHTFTIAVLGDRLIETNETVTATIVNPPAGLTVAAGAATWTITNDDVAPSVQLGPAIKLVEGSRGVSVGRILVSLSKSVPYVVTASYSLKDGSARAGLDFVAAASSQAVTFRPNSTSQWITVQVLGDAVIEQDENFTVELQAAVGATLGANAAVGVTIFDDDSPLVSIRPAQARALAFGTTTLVFTVSLSAAVTAAAPVTIAYRGVDGTAMAGPAGTGDYLLPEGRLTFAPGERVKTVMATIHPRRSTQPYPKRFSLQLFDPKNVRLTGGLSTQTAVGIIS